MKVWASEFCADHDWIYAREAATVCPQALSIPSPIRPQSYQLASYAQSTDNW